MVILPKEDRRVFLMTTLGLPFDILSRAPTYAGARQARPLVGVQPFRVVSNLGGEGG